MRHLRLILAALLLSAIAGYAAWARLEKAPSAGAAKPIPGQAEAPRQAPRVAVVTAVAAEERLPVRRRAVGWVEPIQTVTVRARIDGQIVEQAVQDGQTAKNGDLLFRLDDRELRAALEHDQAQLEKDQATLARAQADARRARDLLARNVAPAQQVDQAEADARVAAATVEADKATLETDRIRLGYATITAPIDGRVGVVRVTPGNLVKGSDSSGDGLVTITQMKPLRVSFTLPDRELQPLREAMSRQGSVPVEVFLHADHGDKPKAEGALSFIDSSVDQASGTITAKAVVPNEDGALWPGQYVDVEVDLGTTPEVAVIPLVAVQPGQNGPFVWVVKPDGSATVRQVTLGETVGDRVAVTAGVKVGEHVVTDGQLRLREGAKVAETVGNGHAAPAPTAQAGQGGQS